MINHVRTFIINTGRNGHGLDEPGEEFIDTDFVPRHLPPGMASIHRVLFGGVSDRLFMNYRIRQIMQIMHATPLEQDIYIPDNRVTYLPFKDDLFSMTTEFDLATTLTLLETAIGTTGISEIFPPLAAEPYQTWLRIYQESQQATVLRFTALMLAFAERVETLPQVRQ